MTDQERQQLAREYANKHLTSGCFNVNGEPRVDVRDLAYFYETLLEDIAKTHCIVKKSGVKEEYEVWRQFLGTKDEDKAMAAMWQLEKVFGTELFEERSEK